MQVKLLGQIAPLGQFDHLKRVRYIVCYTLWMMLFITQQIRSMYTVQSGVVPARPQCMHALCLKLFCRLLMLLDLACPNAESKLMSHHHSCKSFWVPEHQPL